MIQSENAAHQQAHCKIHFTEHEIKTNRSILLKSIQLIYLETLFDSS